MLLCPPLTQTGKLHFGIILGWSVVHSAVLWLIVNQLVGPGAEANSGLDLYSVCCVVGHCLGGQPGRRTWVQQALETGAPSTLSSSWVQVRIWAACFADLRCALF